MRSNGEDFPQTAQAYIAGWLRDGYLERRFPGGAQEEIYELSSSAVGAIRFVAGLVEPKPSATESRLAVVIQQLIRLAQESDADPAHKVAALRAEREKIDREIDEIEQGRFKPLPDDRALERIREIIKLSDDLTGDFRDVRDRFDQLNRDLRERIVDTDGSRGLVLESLFSGVDLIAESDPGRTFSAFWRLLTDPEQSAALDSSLDQVLERPFAAKLESNERRFLLRLTRILLDEGGHVHDVLQNFARSLKHFVQSREYLEQRRLNQLLSQAQRMCLELKENMAAQDLLEYELQLTTSRLRSLSQWQLHDPSQGICSTEITAGEGALIDLETVGNWVVQSEIDFRELKENICASLIDRTQISIGGILEIFPATQGLGSIVGYLSLASRHAIRTDGEEHINWLGADSEARSARIPTLYFLKERAHEL